MDQNQFAETIKQKYPQYANVDNATLTQKMLEKYPQYSGKVTLTPSEPVAGNPTFAANSNDSALTAGLKTLGNVPSSAFQFAKGAVQSLNPVSTVNTIKQIATPSTDGVHVGVGDVLKEIPGAAYHALVPSFLQHLIKGNVDSARQDITNDPVGQIAPFLLAADGVTKGVDAKFGTTTNAALDSGISKTASTITKPIKNTVTGAGNLIGGISKSAASHLTGLDTDTISQVVQHPEAFTKLAQDQVNRGGLAGEFGSKLDSLNDSLNETGAGYDNVRSLPNNVAVPENFISSALNKFGLKLKLINEPIPSKPIPVPGELPTITYDDPVSMQPRNPKYKVIADTTSSTRNVSDINAIQKFVDNWSNKKSLTPHEFLNMRSDLADLANYDKMTGIGKTKQSQIVADSLRQEANNSMRPQIDGLKDLDNTFSEKISQFNQLKKDFLQKDEHGNYTFKDGAINKVANAVGKGKDQLLARMEEVMPGITKRIQILKAVEDIEHAKGLKVGAYARSATAGTAVYLTGGLPAAIVTAIITNPSIAVPLIRGLGYTTAQLAPILQTLRTIGGDINHFKMPIPVTNKK